MKSSNYLKATIVALSLAACAKKEAVKPTPVPALVTFNGDKSYVLLNGVPDGSGAFRLPSKVGVSQDHSVPGIVGMKSFSDHNLAVLELASSNSLGEFVTYRLIYRALSGPSKWRQQTATSDNKWIVLTQLEPGMDYEVRVARACSPSSITGYSSSVRISMRP